MVEVKNRKKSSGQQFEPIKIPMFQAKVVLHYRIRAYFPYLKLYSKILFFYQDHHCVFSPKHNQVRILQRSLNGIYIYLTL